VTKQLVFFSLIFLLVFSCKEDVSITFEDTVFTPKTLSEVDIIYPHVKENHNVAKLINSEIEHYIVQQIDFKDDSTLSIEDAIKTFDDELKQFKTDFPESPQYWELSIEGEVLYQTPQLICIGINSYSYTGGAHGNDRIDFLNFAPETGKLLSITDLIDDMEGFSKLVETHLEQTIKKNKNESMDDYFFGEGFKLPESLGFNEEGLIILYNKYEIASYAQGITEFVIPYEEADPFLKIIP